MSKDNNSYKRFLESIDSENNKIPRNVHPNPSTSKMSTFLPLPVPKIVTPSQANQTTKAEEKPVVVKKWFMNNIFHDLKIYSGNVEDVLRRSKKHHSEFIYEVFAKVAKIRNGQNLTEKCLLLRNESGTGPVLSAVLYDVNNQLRNIIPGNTVRCCLRFSTNQFYIIKIKKAGTGMVEFCNRLQNICNLVMED